MLTETEIREFLAADYLRLVNAMALVSGSVAAAEDAVQEGLARAWEVSERGEVIASLPSWVAVVARNLLRDRLRRLVVERRARLRLADRGEARGGLPGAEHRADLERALALLPRRQREVAVFRYYLDLEVSEIARLLSLPEGTVKSSLFRARQALAEAMDERERSREVGSVSG